MNYYEEIVFKCIRSSLIHCSNSVILCLLDFIFGRKQFDMVQSSAMFLEIGLEEKSYLGRDVFLYNNKLLCGGVYFNILTCI